MESLVDMVSEKMKDIAVPYGMTVHGEDEIEAVVNVLRTSTQMGVNVREMEAQVAKLYAKKFGLMVNSGSSALYLAMEAIDLPKGSEVITPALTFSTTVGCLVKNGLVPAFVDVEPDTYNIDANQVEELISPRTKAMVIPNLIGNLPVWEQLHAIAKKHKLVILEDSADTLGAKIKGESSGRFSDVATTSFYGSHVINCAGNGGMVCFNNEEWARKTKLLRSWGRSSSLFVESEKIENRFNVKIDDIDYDAKFLFEMIGYNLEPNELGAAFGLVQLKKLTQNIDTRIRNFETQYKFFKKYEKWFMMPRQAADTYTGWLAFPLIVRPDAPFARKDMQIFLENRKIQTRVVFTGNILRQPGFKSITKVTNRANKYPNADQVMRGGVLLACHHGLTPEMISHVHSTFDEFAKKYL